MPCVTLQQVTGRMRIQPNASRRDDHAVAARGGAKGGATGGAKGGAKVITTPV
jgi:hypothetical protein